MLKKDQYKDIFIGIFILVALIPNPSAAANDLTFNPKITEFILKNTSSLIYQIKEKKGLGYNSLKNQIILSGCNPKTVFSDNLLKKKKPYLFSKDFSKKIDKCKKNNNGNIDIESALKNKEVYLIVAEESLKSPMSYFGHSLLLFLDKDDFYFSPVVSISAPTDNLTAVEQITKGGFSHIEAKINITPLHQIIDYYGHKESRKLKFINLSDHLFNREKLIQYFKNKSSENLSYNFFYQNCSTYLYEALNYSCNCFKKKPMIITPSLLELKIQNLDREAVEFKIDSLHHKFKIQFEELKRNEKKIAKDIFSNTKFNTEKNQKSGKVAALASRLSFKSYGNINPGYENALETYGEDYSLLRSIPYDKKTEKNHDNLKNSSIKIKKSKNALNLKLSAIDFNQLEQRTKKFTFSELSVGTIDFLKKNETTQVESVYLLNIKALTPIDFVTKTPSWRLKLGAERDEKNRLKSLFSFGIGVSYSLSNLTFYTLPSIESKSSLTFPIYSGVFFKNRSIVINYKTKNLKKNSLSIYKRGSESIGYEYKISKNENLKTEHQIGLSYYF
ncbi:DUF4105 domain-containing protein [Marinomonas arenicola]|uniref:DUF4105 domain-containing protein n=1 Tax=Marinomonas arenicola TaxID=569601 RepID=A0ABU9G4R9_9GAMM